MTTTVEAPATGVLTWEQFQALPVGATVRLPAGNEHHDWTLQDDGIWRRGTFTARPSYFRPAVESSLVVSRTAEAIAAEAVRMHTGDLMQYSSYIYVATGPSPNRTERWDVLLFGTPNAQGECAFYGVDNIASTFKSREDVRQVDPTTLGVAGPMFRVLTAQYLEQRATLEANTLRINELNTAARQAQRDYRRLELEAVTLREQARTLQGELRLAGEQRAAAGRFPEGFVERLQAVARDLDDDALNEAMEAFDIAEVTEHQSTVVMTGYTTYTPDTEVVANDLDIPVEQITDIGSYRAHWRREFTVTREGVGCQCDEVSESDDDVREEVPENYDTFSIDVTCHH